MEFILFVIIVVIILLALSGKKKKYSQECSNCGWKNENQEKFCPKCGKNLEN